MLMKRAISYFWLVTTCASFSFAGYSDGYITVGEYEYGVEWSTSDPPLIVMGGGADGIITKDHGLLEVRSTSIPVNENWHTGGVRDVIVDDYSKLLYLDGKTDFIRTSENATAVLKSGSINYIKSLQDTNTKHIDLYCRPGWSWTGQKTGITGQWENGTGFNITLINDSDYDPTWMNINIIEVPEPTTLALLALGGMLIRCKRKS